MAISAAPSNTVASPSPVICQTMIAVPNSAPMYTGASAKVSVRRGEQRDEHQQRVEERGDLGHRVLHHRDRQLGLALGGEHDPGHVLDRVAGDRHDHQAGEGLGDVELWIVGCSAVDEPVRDERRAPPRRSRAATSADRDSATRRRLADAVSPDRLIRAQVLDAATSRRRRGSRPRRRSRSSSCGGWPGRGSRSASPISTMMKLAISSSVAVSLGSRGLKRMIPSRSRRRAGDDHQPEDEQRVDQDRAEDRRLGDDLLAGVQREDDHEELGQVAQRRLHERR